MKKFIFIFIFFSLCLFTSKSQADAILWSELTVYLDTITFTTTGDLDVWFEGCPPRGTLVSRNEVMYSEIETGSSMCIECNYVGGDPEGYTTVRKTWNLESTGSGDFTMAFDLAWEYDALPWAMPDATAGGPDNFNLFVVINGSTLETGPWWPLDGITIGGLQLNVPPPDAINAPGFQLNTHYFGEGEIETLTIIATTNANGRWIDMPIPPTKPVPEPSTMLLLGTGLIGLAGWGRRKFKKN